ncbi:MAG: AAA family ATPase [Lachnospiraceae bacterium]|nr:AAA family ATPase [Lachnospiraceae bacterium]
MKKKSNIIFLNGPSSAGKSTLARQIQSSMPQPFYYMAIDQYQLGVMPQEEQFFEIDLHEISMEMFYDAVKAHIDKGYDLILDDVIDSDAYDQYVKEALKEATVFWIRLECSLPILIQRELLRLDRKIDVENVTKQFHNLRPLKNYDLIIDSEHCDAVTNSAIVRKEFYHEAF